MIKMLGIKILFYSALAVGIVTWGCASHDSRMGSLKLRTNDYKKLLEEQMASAHAEKTALDRLPEMTDVDHERLGDVHFRQGELGRAFVQYNKAFRLNPNKTRIRYKMGLLFLAGGLTQEAIVEFQEVLKKEPDDALAHEGIGLAVFKSGQPEAAEKHFKQALKLDPKLWKAHSVLGIIYNRQNLLEAAVREHQMAIMLEPNKGILYNNLGISYALMGEYDDAVRAFETGLKTGTPHKKIYNNLGLVLSRLGRSEEALKAFRLGGDEAQAYNNLGCVYLQQGEREKAIRSFEKAIELRPTFYAKASENLEKATSVLLSESLYDSKIQTESLELDFIRENRDRDNPKKLADFYDMEIKGTIEKKAAPLREEVEPLVESRAVWRNYTVSIGSFKEKMRADRYAKQLEQGLKAFTWEIDIPGKGRWHRVCIGNFSTRKEAELFAREFEQKGLETFVVKFSTGQKAPDTP